MHFDNIRLGKADIIITGGSEAVISAAGVEVSMP